ncbi:sigma-70 family RNA polymerase sigma factor [Clostridium hydrogenum]|uniref:sigma-70 family RNA polymerase sigma factor n=1 Tax=Clostridium hydrogenum TaxID=2855764 RepID=UPI001F355F94|nr:sigma-70 family RNA polymerase sigma factor [Clostridium hydrogenum]
MRSNSENFIKRLKRKKEDALEYTYDKYIPLVKGIVCKVLLRFEDNGVVEECINDVFLAVWNNSNKFEGDEKIFRSWIGAIAKYKAIDYYRKLMKRTEDIMDSIDIEEKNTLEDEIMINENKKDVMKLLCELEELDKQIFIMKYFLGLKAEEIGEKLGISKAAVDSRVFRSKKKLKIKANNIKLEVV